MYRHRGNFRVSDDISRRSVFDGSGSAHHLDDRLEKATYDEVKRLRAQQMYTLDALREVRTDAELELRRKWKEHLERPEVSGRRIVNAILPYMEAWLNRIHGQCLFRLT